MSGWLVVLKVGGLVSLVSCLLCWLTSWVGGVVMRRWVGCWVGQIVGWLICWLVGWLVRD